MKGSPPGATPLSGDEIMRMLPHRHPFLMVDRVLRVDPGNHAEAVKNISAADPVLAGHFPGRMIYPGVLLVECVAQLAAIVYGTGALQRAGGTADDAAARVGYLAEIKQTKFHRPVVPGDQVVLRVHSGPRHGRLIAVNGQASVDAEVVMNTRLTVTERDDGTATSRTDTALEGIPT